MKSFLLKFVVPAALIFVYSAEVSANRAKKIMPLGDSITRGWYGSNDRWGYRRPLYYMLLSNGYSFNLVGSCSDGAFPDPQHEGHDGWRADEILNGRPGSGAGKLSDWLAAHQPDIVLLHIGTNDVTAGNQDANEVNAILNVIDAYENANSKIVTVVLALIINRVPYSSITTQYNNDLRTMALNRISGGDDIIIVDMEPVLDYSTDLADSLHPNDAGYEKMAFVWYNALADVSKSYLEETNQRLELRTQGGLLGSVAFYMANGWRFGVEEDFAIKVDFHYGSLSYEDSWIGLNVGDDVNYVSISAGSDGELPYFYYEAVVNGNIVFEKEGRLSDDGTLYLSYNAAAKNFYLSHTGYGSANAYVWIAPEPTQGQWNQPVTFAMGGGSSGTVLGPGEAYLDNFEVATGGLLDWPPATDLDENGYVELNDLAIICENWLESGLGDVDESGLIDLFDLAELGLAL